MYILEIQDFCGIQTGRIEIEPGKTALVGGINAAGKSSTARAAACAASAIRMPCGAAMKEAEKYIRRGAEKATVFLKTPDGDGRKIVWKPGEVDMQGEAEKIGMSAAGLQPFTSLEAADKSKFLTQALKAEVTQQDFEQELVDQLGEDRGRNKAKELWQEVSTLGFDSVLESQKSEGIILKRKWQEATGKSRWTVNALEWLPDGWTPDLGTAETQDLAKAVADAQEALENAIRVDAVHKANTLELKTQVSLLPALNKAAADLKEEVSGAEMNLNTARALLLSMPTGEQPKGMPCPSCKCELVVENGALVQAQTLGADELSKRKTERDAQQTRVSELEKLLADINKRYAENRANTQIANAAETKLRDLEKQREQLKAGGLDVDAARTAVALAERRVRCKTSKAFADQTHQQIVDNEKLLAILAPAGLRRKKLEQALDKFAQTMLYPLCATARAADPKWQDVTINPDLSVSFGQGTYDTISGSEQFRTNAILQIGLALVQKKPLIIIDGADELDAQGRGGLMSILKTVDISALVCMMVSDKAQLPDISKRGAGTTYWVEQGVITQLSAAAATV